jgi:glycosyltransferase involved in cell wall biosynthesis
VTEAPLRPEPRVSLVVPVFNEEQVLPLLLERLRATLDALPGGGEAVLVNDGSRDRSIELLLEASRQDPRLRVIDLSRNFGQAAALTAGLDHAQGDAVVFLDADLQDPPELVKDMVALYRRGYDVVHARRSARHRESLLKRLTAFLFYRLMGATSDVPLAQDVGEFRLVGREVADALRGLRERHRMLRGLVGWVGFRQAVIEFERPGRAAGETKFPFTRMLTLSFDALTSFSAAPLRLASALGVFGIVVGVSYAVYAIYIGWVLGLGVPGWTSLVIVNIFFSAVVLLCLGLIGEYVGRIFEEVKHRPLYVVRTGPDGQARPESRP